MVETKCNYKGLFKQNIKCEVCKGADHTTEHLLQCKETLSKNEMTISVEDIKNANHEIVKQIKKVMERRKELGYKINIGGNEESDDNDEEEG